MVFWCIASFSSSWFLQYWIQEYYDRGNAKVFVGISLMILSVVIMTKMTRTTILFLGNLQVSRTVDLKMVVSLTYASLSTFFDRIPIGRILNRFLKDTEEIDIILAFKIDRVVYFT